MKQIDFFNEMGDPIRAQRIKERVEYDMEMIKELGHCSGIENYSRYFDGREAGQKPYCLLDFFPDADADAHPDTDADTHTDADTYSHANPDAGSGNGLHLRGRLDA